MWRVYVGALGVIAGIAALVEAHNHRPEYECKAAVSACELGEGLHLLPGHLTETPYDLLSGVGWALVIVGAATLILGLIGFWRATPSR
jgi:hypothetical protein